MRAIWDAIETGRLDATTAVVISNNAASPALVAARERGIPAYHLNAKICGGDSEADKAIATAFSQHNVEMVVLSGYMKRIGSETLAAYPDAILNIHPSLLPAFGGPGMYGLRVHTAVLEAGVTETGATVHMVDEVYDHGRILQQIPVPVLQGDTPQELQARVAACEGELYVRVLQSLCGEKG